MLLHAGSVLLTLTCSPGRQYPAPHNQTHLLLSAAVFDLGTVTCQHHNHIVSDLPHKGGLAAACRQYDRNACVPQSNGGLLAGDGFEHSAVHRVCSALCAHISSDAQLPAQGLGTAGLSFTILTGKRA
jgi:hypothetical protein